MEQHLEIIRAHNEADSREVRRNLVEYNHAHLPKEFQNGEPIGFYLKDSEGRLLGGITGYRAWDHVHVDIFWLHEDIRKQGYGAQLLSEVEQYAREHQCRYIDLDTFSFQAPDFYQKYGFEVFGKIEQAVCDATRYFLIKWL